MNDRYGWMLCNALFIFGLCFGSNVERKQVPLPQTGGTGRKVRRRAGERKEGEVGCGLKPCNLRLIHEMNHSHQQDRSERERMGKKICVKDKRGSN